MDVVCIVTKVEDDFYSANFNVHDMIVALMPGFIDT